LPGFFCVDAGVFTKISETWRAQLNIENVFNKGYWASADGNNNITRAAAYRPADGFRQVLTEPSRPDKADIVYRGR
jgi:outer membrane receptor protein involved in Fe transport